VGAEFRLRSIADLVGFFRAGISIFVACIGVSLLIKFSQLFYEYGTLFLPREALSPTRLLLPVIQSFIPVAVCLFTTWHLASGGEGAPRHSLFLVRTLLAIAGTVGFLAVLYDLTFLSEYLRVRPQDGPGWEHLLFSVVANAVISVCAFLSIVLFFKSRNILQKPVVALQRQGAGAIGTPATAILDLTHRQHALPTERPTQTQGAERSARPRGSAPRQSAGNGHVTPRHPKLHFGDGLVEPA
jgi:hypothetical protein